MIFNKKMIIISMLYNLSQMGSLESIESGFYSTVRKKVKLSEFQKYNYPNLKIGCFRLDGAHANRGLGRGLNLFWKA
jgi:hypothetical protein